MKTIDDFREFVVEKLDLIIGGNVAPEKTYEVTCRPSGNDPNDPD